MKTKPKTVKLLLYILLALTLTFIFSLQVKATSSPAFYWSPQIVFKLPATNTIVKFADWAYFTSFSWDKWQASKVTFNNLLVGGGPALPLSSLCLSSPNTDITILSANSESVKLNLADTDKILQVWNLDVKTVNVGGNYFTKDDFFVSYTEWQACNQDSIFQNETLTAIKAVSSTTITLGLIEPDTTENVRIILPVNGKLCFQNDIENYLTLEVVDGILNITDFDFHLDSDGGYFKFTTPALISVEIAYSNLTVKVAKGDEPLQLIKSGAIISVTDQMEIVWDVPHEIPVEPLLPMMFIFGMVGLGAMIGGPLYLINKIKKGEYLEGFRTGIVVTVIGLALFIAWLW